MAGVLARPLARQVDLLSDMRCWPLLREQGTPSTAEAPLLAAAAPLQSASVTGDGDGGAGNSDGGSGSGSSSSSSSSSSGGEWVAGPPLPWGGGTVMSCAVIAV